MVHLPVALAFFRLVAGGIFFLLAFLRAPDWLLVTLLCAGMLSDVVDGIIARRSGVASLALRRFDTRADMVFYAGAVAAAIIRGPFPPGCFWPWLIAYLVLFVARNFVDYLRYRASPSYHMWTGKLWAAVVFVHLVALFHGVRAPFLLPLAFALYAINAAEGIVATLILPRPGKDVPTAWHAFTLALAPGKAAD